MTPAANVQPILIDTQSDALAATDGGVAMFERLARDPSVAVDKLERMMAMWERAQAQKAARAFNSALADAQKAMRPVAADAYNPQTKSKYASYAALDSALRPIYSEHGFALSFDTADAPQPDYVRVVCEVTHTGGHAKPYHIDMPADGKGAKGGDVMTKTHAAGSAVSYGMRYLLKMIFNVAVGEEDDDGNRAAKKQPVNAPAGFDDWWLDMQAVGDEGTARLQEAWSRAPAEQRRHLLATNPSGWAALKNRAAKVVRA